MALPLAHWAGTLAPLQLVPVAVMAIAYERRARSLARAGRPIPLWRALCFAGGIALILIALVSPAAHIGEELLLAHMAQHLLLGDLAALLIVLGLTGPVLAPLLRIRAVDRLRVLAHPAVALPLWAASLLVWHLAVLYQATLTSGPVHALEHGIFLGFGILMWMPVAGPLPQPSWFGDGAKLAYVIGVRAVGAALGNVLIWSGSVLYPDYAAGERFWNISPLTDQGVAGTIMMVEGSIVTLGVFVWLFLRWAQRSSESQELLDYADSRGVKLDAARAERAVAAGHGRRLKEKLRARGSIGES
jgi:cytochrome c oxidase assembly factor CtaG